MSMYDEFFALGRPPFRITPDTNLFYSGAKRGAVLDALVYSVLNGEGIIKVVGEVGSGKTMLCRMLEIRLPRHVEIVYIVNPSLSPENILQVIAFELKVVVDATVSKLEAMQKLQGLLMRRHAQGKQVVVFIEEAQGMPLATLEEVRLLSNLETEQSKLMQVVLFGQPELDENLSDPSIRQLRERITQGFHLEPLEAVEVCEYLNFRMWVSGYRGADIFDKFISRRITDYSHGMIRRINILADKTLLAAYADNTRTLRKSHVLTAARDSQFIEKKNRGNNWALIAGVALATGVAVAVVMFAVLRAGHFDKQRVASRTPTSPVEDAVRPREVAPVATGQIGAAAEAAVEKPGLPLEGGGATGIGSEPESHAAPVIEQLAAESAGDSPVETEPAIQPSELAVEPVDAVTDTNRQTARSSETEQQDIEVAGSTGADISAGNISDVGSVEVLPVAIEISMDGSNYDHRLTQRLQHTRDWISRSSVRGYSIQLLTVDRKSADKLSEYLEKLPAGIDLDKVYVYETEIRGSIKLAVIYNLYSSLDNAWIAVEALPARLQRWQPFVRTVRSVKSEIAG